MAEIEFRFSTVFDGNVGWEHNGKTYRLVLLMRAEWGGFLWRSDSYDGGRTWSPPHISPVKARKDERYEKTELPVIGSWLVADGIGWLWL